MINISFSDSQINSIRTILGLSAGDTLTGAKIVDALDNAADVELTLSRETRGRPRNPLLADARRRELEALKAKNAS